VALRLRLTESTDTAAALTWLETFLAKHPLPVFQEEALRLEIKLGRTPAAVQRLDAMIATAPRPESLLLRKARLLATTGDQAGAQSAARAALSAVARLPVHLRSTRACTELEQEARTLLYP
jgi:predicted Zn-dependent protease